MRLRRSSSAGENVPARSFFDAQIQLPGRGCQSPLTGPVAVGGSCVAAFERASADERGRLPLDQLLVERLGRNSNSVGELQLAEEVEQGRLVESHRVVSFA